MLDSINSFLDEYLKIREIEDYPNALNGLQLENDGSVHRIGAGVDASEEVIRMAIESRVNLLIVHHGIFWGGLKRLAGSHFRKIKDAMFANLAIYSVHLPLDLHPEVGNNILLARSLKLAEPEPFLFFKGQSIGYAMSVDIGRDALVGRLREILGRDPWVCPAGPERILRLGIVTGGAGGEVEKAAREGVDTFITGEGPHHTHALAEELRLNLIYGGHYATETFGVRAIAELVSAKFSVPWIFLDHSSGL